MMNSPSNLARAEMVYAERSAFFARLFRYLLLAMRIRRERDQLRDLTDDQLADIGVSRYQAETEAEREALDIPAHRKATLYL